MNINPRLRYYPIGVRITLSVLLPMLGLMMLAGWIIADKWTLARTADRLQEMAGLASRLSAVVHELQRERGSSALFLGSKGSAFKEQLAAQRRATDASRTTLEGSLARLDPAIRGTLDRKLEVMGKDTREMLARRNDIDAVSVDPREAIALYTRTVGDVISIVKDLALSSPDAQIGNRIAAYVNLMEGKERAGQERATGSAGFAAGKFPPDLYRRYIALAAEENAFYSVFRTFAAPEVTAFFERTLSGEVVSEVERFRKIAYDSTFTGHTGEVKAPDWFAAATRRIDVLKSIEDRIAADLAGIALDVTRSAHATLWGTLAFTVLLLAGGAFLALAMIQGTTRPLRELTAVMSRLAAGDLSASVSSLDRKDEIGHLAKAFALFKEKAVVMAGAAQQMTHVAAAAEQISHAVRQVAEGSVNQLQSVQAVAEAMRHTNHAVGEVAAGASAATHSVREAASTVEEGKARMRPVVTLVASIADTSKKINHINHVIARIAAQTNMLSLNAAIEAARAGEHGKGFAVVAEEVRKLADTTSSSAGEISGLVDMALRQAEDGVHLVAQVDQSMQAIADQVETSDRVMRRIADAIAEQSASVEQITGNVTGLGRVSEANASAAEEISTTVLELARIADHARAQVAGVRK